MVTFLQQESPAACAACFEGDLDGVYNHRTRAELPALYRRVNDAMVAMYTGARGRPEQPLFGADAYSAYIDPVMEGVPDTDFELLSLEEKKRICDAGLQVMTMWRHVPDDTRESFARTMLVENLAAPSGWN